MAWKREMIGRRVIFSTRGVFGEDVSIHCPEGLPGPAYLTIYDELGRLRVKKKFPNYRSAMKTANLWMFERWRKIMAPSRRKTSRLGKMIEREARRWFQEQSRNPFTRFYLYYKPSTQTKWGDIRVAPESPGKGWELATGEALGRHTGRFWTYNDAVYWISQQVRRLPLLPTQQGQMAPSQMDEELIRRILAGAPEPGPIAKDLAGWQLPNGLFLCAYCAGRIMARGFHLPRESIPLWRDGKIPEAYCAGCGRKIE